MRIMLDKKFVDKVLAYGREKGLKDMELYYSDSEELTMKVFDGEIDNYSVSKSGGVSFRTHYAEKMGYAYTEKLDDFSVQFLVDNAMDNALIIDSDDEERIFEGAGEYKTRDNKIDLEDRSTQEDKIQGMLEMESMAKNMDSRIQKVQYCVYGELIVKSKIVNSKGLDLCHQANLAYTYLGVVAKEGEEIKTGMSYRVGEKFTDLDTKAIAKEAVEEAIAMLGASSVKSGDYPVIIKNNAAADLLEAFSSVFSAENVQKDLSLLKGKIGDKIAVDDLNIIDDPHMEKGFSTRFFDDEGFPTKRNEIVKDGILKTYMHNLKTAKKSGIESTGHASRGSYKSSIGISPTNFYFEPGKLNLDQMIMEMSKGLVIIDLQGLHSGLNPVSGDFSLSCYGYYVEEGKIVKPVNQITVSGNFFQLLKNIERIGSDLKFTLPSNAYIGSPSIWIQNLSIAGE